MLRNVVVRTLAFLFFLSATLTAAGRDSNATWLELRSPHFTLLTDSNEKQARHVVGQLERMRAVFHTLFPEATGDLGAPIIVLALKDKKDFQTLEPAAYLAKGQLDLAGLFLRAPDMNPGRASLCDRVSRIHPPDDEQGNGVDAAVAQ